MKLLNPDFNPRIYQELILASAIVKNTLVVLPTGLGKTAIAAMLAAKRLEQYPDSKVLFLAPTKPLVEQHRESFKKLLLLPEDDFVVFTGFVKPSKRAELWLEKRVIFSTPQGLENDLISNRISLKDVSLLVFDEAHRATGDYSYVFIAKRYVDQAHHPRVLALTASPGSDEESILSVCNNLFIESIEVRGYDDPDIKPYVNSLRVSWEEVVLEGDFLSLKKSLEESYNNKLKEAESLGFLTNLSAVSKSSLLGLQAELQSRAARGEKDFDLLRTISLLAEAMKLQHALELCETQTLSSLNAYLEDLVKQSSSSRTRAVKNLVKDPGFLRALALSRRLLSQGLEHPKVSVLRKLVARIIYNDPSAKIIVFTQYRDTAVKLKEVIDPIVKSVIFVGQAKKRGSGLSQKQQQEVLDSFRNGDYKVLIATSVAEEGLDIPSVDHVIFYEPIPSAIRTVQRRGRTGRHGEGFVTVLVTKGTRDEAYRWSAHHKEKRMYKTIKKIQKSYFFRHDKNSSKKDSSLNDFVSSSDSSVPSSPQSSSGSSKVLVDFREKGSPVLKLLLDYGVDVELKQLPVGDYVVGSDIVIEYKSVKDFVDSIIDGRLLSQLRALREKPKPVIIVEGSEDIYSQRNINPDSVRGLLASIIVNYQIPVIRTVDARDTAGLIRAFLRRTDSDKSVYNPHFFKPRTLREQQEYLVSSLPGVGGLLAKNLLERFGSVINVFNASKEELQKVELIGPKKAEQIRRVLDENYFTLDRGR